jgi:3',5'-cyclic-AMP phosphodiesterase
MVQEKNAPNSRRDFLKASSVSLLSLTIPDSMLGLFTSVEKLKIGLISDLHVDVIHDGKERLQIFLDQMQLEKPDALIQMGDFAIPKSENFELIQSFNSAHPRAYHVLGNHDMDEEFSREDAAKAFGMPSFYYSTELGSIQLIVLDGNDPGGPTKQGIYDSYIGPSQQAWLVNELEKAHKPVLVVSHQPFAGIYPIVNSLEIQTILSRFSSKILLAINGHAHVDQHIEVDGVHYVHINSSSYYWVGEKLKHQSLSSEIHENHPSLQFTCPYLDPLFALLTIDPKSREISIQGRKTEWIGPSPFELGYPILTESEQKSFLQPQISNRKI